jgi:hypothetical protein
MKNKHSPSAMAGRGGHPSPARSIAPGLDLRGTGLLAAALAVTLSACSSSPTASRPPAGFAVLDASPERERRDRIKGIHVVSVNRVPVRGSEAVLTPGRNKVRIGYTWPQGGSQEVDLVFHARPNSSYVVQYVPSPAYANRLVEIKKWDDAAGDVASMGVGAGQAAFIFAPPAMALLGVGFANRVGSQMAEAHKPATSMDLMVISRDNGEGIVRRVRAYPDGRVDSASWAAYAQMSSQSRLWR